MITLFMHTQHVMMVGDTTLAYTLKKSIRARRMRIVVRHDGSVVATMPVGSREVVIEKFIRDKARWILDKVALVEGFSRASVAHHGRAHYLKHKESARTLVMARVAHYSDRYGFKYESISIRNQKTRWGSCSKNGNLNFNYNIAFLPEPLADYIIVHELCHLKEFNHSKKFWALVESIIPAYQTLRKELTGKHHHLH